MTHQKGFTLLEVLLVIVIIAVSAAGIVTMQSERLGPSGKLRQQVEIFSQTVEFAADLALLEKHVVGLQLTTDGWLFYQPIRDPAHGWQWEEMANSDNLPLTGQWGASLKPDVAPPPERAKPQIIILPDGYVTPFALGFSHQNGGAMLSLRCNGSLPLDIRLPEEPQ
ncbi:hypothetical protein AC791_06330 [Klebsiella sp. RIT-PI-d]|uniref:type II secretion system minor pseudopilin GspH n=1 Tax=Klebsiella sp. RIT-PI-d TaxID=1681196 RepID=UPI000676A0A0|nr:type II secretion system minor pseudopilin GspH [Klebsiella sp. RIT-PI-d]KNC10550.1 hypothetical protein AC791_06330 [Klebsiella sp. RIT-PI-d]